MQHVTCVHNSKSLAHWLKTLIFTAEWFTVTNNTGMHSHPPTYLQDVTQNM